MRLAEEEFVHALKWRFTLLPDEVTAALKFRAFCMHSLGIELHVGQVAFAGMVLVRRPDSHIARFLTMLLTSGNRAGKTVILACLVIYSCLKKLNLSAPDALDPVSVTKWGNRAYHWYHFGIRQEVSELVFNEIVKILNGFHEGQKAGCPITRSGAAYADDEASPIADWDSKEYSEYPHIRFRKEFGGAEVHFRTTGAKALGQLGRDMHGITFDEPGIEPNLDFLIKEVFGMRRMATGGQLILASTPSEALGTAFADNWRKGDPMNPMRLPSWSSMRMSTRDNIGYGLTQEMFDILTTDMDDRTIQQNIEGHFLQPRTAYFNGANVEAIFQPRLPAHTRARHGVAYLQGVDPAKSQDSAWSIVLAVVENPSDPAKPYLVGVKAEKRVGQKSTATLVELVAAQYHEYNLYMRPNDGARRGSICYTAIDATGFGGKLFREALDAEVPNISNVEFGGTAQVKRKLLGNLRTLIDEGRILLPEDGVWKEVRRQLLGYKLEDRGIEQDAVMALVCAVTLLKRAPVGGVLSTPFDSSIAV